MLNSTRARDKTRSDPPVAGTPRNKTALGLITSGTMAMYLNPNDAQRDSSSFIMAVAHVHTSLSYPDLPVAY